MRKRQIRSTWADGRRRPLGGSGSRASGGEWSRSRDQVACTLRCCLRQTRLREAHLQTWARMKTDCIARGIGSKREGEGPERGRDRRAARAGEHVKRLNSNDASMTGISIPAFSLRAYLYSARASVGGQLEGGLQLAARAHTEACIPKSSTTGERRHLACRRHGERPTKPT